VLWAAPSTFGADVEQQAVGLAARHRESSAATAGTVHAADALDVEHGCRRSVAPVGPRRDERRRRGPSVTARAAWTIDAPLLRANREAPAPSSLEMPGIGGPEDLDLDAGRARRPG